MKKKLKLLSFLLFLFVLQSVFAQTNYGSDFRLQSMGETGVSDPGDWGSYFRNPAALFSHNKVDVLSVSLEYEDLFSYEGSASFPVMPASDIRIRFAGTNLSAGLIIGARSLEREIEETYRKMDIEKNVVADFCFSIGVTHFSAGVGLTAGIQWIRENVLVYDSARFNQLLLNMVAGEYRKLENGQFFNLRGGLQINYAGFIVGLLVPDAFYFKEGISYFSFENLLNSMQLGISYYGSKYGKRAHLLPVVVGVNSEFENVVSEDRKFNIGLEVSYQMLSDYVVYGRAGYKSQNGDLVPQIITAGMGLKLKNFYFNFYSNIPLTDEKAEYGVSVGYTR